MNPFLLFVIVALVVIAVIAYTDVLDKIGARITHRRYTEDGDVGEKLPEHEDAQKG